MSSIGQVLSSASGTAGRPHGPKKPLEELLDAYVKYRAERIGLHQPAEKESREGFRKKVGLSDQGLRDYLKHANLPFPLLPIDRDTGKELLVCTIWGQPPYDITWIIPSVRDVLSCDPADLVGHGCALPLLRGNSARLEAEHTTMIQRLRTDPQFVQAEFSTTLHRRSDNAQLPVDVVVRYTGKTHDRFYCVAQITGPAIVPPVAETFNTTGEIFRLRKESNTFTYTPPLNLTPPDLQAPGQFVFNPPSTGRYVLAPMPSIAVVPPGSPILLQNGRGSYAEPHHTCLGYDSGRACKACEIRAR